MDASQKRVRPLKRRMHPAAVVKSQSTRLLGSSPQQPQKRRAVSLRSFKRRQTGPLQGSKKRLLPQEEEEEESSRKKTVAFADVVEIVPEPRLLDLGMRSSNYHPPRPTLLSSLSRSRKKGTLQEELHIVSLSSGKRGLRKNAKSVAAFDATPQKPALLLPQEPPTEETSSPRPLLTREASSTWQLTSSIFGGSIKDLLTQPKTLQNVNRQLHFKKQKGIHNIQQEGSWRPSRKNLIVFVLCVSVSWLSSLSSSSSCDTHDSGEVYPVSWVSGVMDLLICCFCWALWEVGRKWLLFAFKDADVRYVTMALAQIRQHAKDELEKSVHHGGDRRRRKEAAFLMTSGIKAYYLSLFVQKRVDGFHSMQLEESSKSIKSLRRVMERSNS